MSVDNCPTCPDCGDDLVSAENSEKGFGWRCPDCLKWFDIPDYDPEPKDSAYGGQDIPDINPTGKNPF